MISEILQLHYFGYILLHDNLKKIHKNFQFTVSFPDSMGAFVVGLLFLFLFLYS